AASESTDVILLIDSSDVLGRRAFPLIKGFVQKVVNSLPIGPNNYRVALAQYSDDIHIEFQLNGFRGKNPMLAHIKRSFSFRGGSLRTGNAIQKVHEAFFKTTQKDRNQIVVVTVSGSSEDDVEGPAKMLQDAGIKIIALGIQDAQQHELQSMATKFYHFRTPRDLQAFSPNMSSVIESAVEMDIVTDCQSDSVADVVFVVDESVGNANVEYIKTFLQNSINSLDVTEECIRIGLVKYSTETQVVSFLSKETEKKDILQRIQSFSPRAGKANLGAAINITRKQVFTERAGSRKNQGVKQIATIITHRPSDDSLTEAAEQLINADITVFAIGIEGANISQLNQVVSYPPNRNIIQVTFSDLPRESDTLKKKLFNEIQNMLYVKRERKVHLKTGCVDTERADIYFLIDGSTSINSDSFHKDMKTFLKEVIKMFTVGPDHVRFGVVQYSNIHRTEFEIDKHSTISNLEKAINNIQYLTGDTYTGAALESMLGLFESARKQRKNKVPTYLIVLTDGDPHDKVKEPADRLRKAGINVIAIGVGDIKWKGLQEIGESNVYYVHQYASLKTIKDNIVQDICSEEACKEMKADIMFLVDSSGSIGDDNFKKMKTFIKEVVNRSYIGVDQVQVGVVHFSDTSKEVFSLNKNTSKKSDIIQAVEDMSLIGSTTNTGGALRFVSKYFKLAKQARPSVNKILVLITDGEASDEVTAPATELRNDGIIIYSVGVFNANKTQLEEISGKPEKVFYVENFDILEDIKGDIIFGICSPYKPEDCKRANLLDVVFVIDSSGSIGPYNYAIMKDFVIDIVNKSDVGNNRVQFGAVKYSAYPQILFNLNGNKADIIDKIKGDTLLNDTTYTAEALRHAENLFTESKGSRKRRGVPQLLMVITDGTSHDKDKLDAVSTRIRNDGITIYAIGIKDAKREELEIIAENKDHVFFVDTFDGLKNLSVIDNYCPTASNNAKNILFYLAVCNIHAEIVFLIDGSGSIPKNDFEIVKDFLTKLVDSISFHDNIQFGMAQFSDIYSEEFPLGHYQSKSELKNKIANVSMQAGLHTYIGKGLKEVKAFFKSPRRRVARNVHQKLLIFTDGESKDSFTQPAEDLRREGVEIHAVGVGKIEHAKLQQITVSPERIYTTANYTGLPHITKGITEEMSCFVDVLMGFDISSQKPGDHLFSNQRLLETYLPSIIKDFTSLSSVSCNKGTTTQFSVAIPIENTDQPLLASLEVDDQKIIEKLRNVVINSPSHLNVKFLDSLWNSFQGLSDTKNRSKVLLLFSDGMDDDIKALEKKSEELRKQGLNGIITVALEGATNFHDLRYIEFGKGFGYNEHLTIEQMFYLQCFLLSKDKIAERKCCCVFCKCTGEKGPPGQTGKIGPRVRTSRFLNLSLQGNSGPRGPPGDSGQKGFQGDPVSLPQLVGSYFLYFISEVPTLRPVGQTRSSKVIYLASTLNFRKHQCPVYPTELVFALDASQDTTPQLFRRMKELVIEVVNNTEIRESNCPVGARVAVVSYNSETNHLIRFSDFHSKKKLLLKLAGLSYQRSTSKRDLGGSMRYVARNIFKRTLSGVNVRKVAVFFSNGQSENPTSIDTAVLEFRALDILPAVIAFKNVPRINRAFMMDDTRLFQVLNIQQETDYIPALQKLQSCVICYDKCKPDESCFTEAPPPPEAYMDAAFILESSRKISLDGFDKLKDFLSGALDNLSISKDPKTSSIGDRVAVLSHAPKEFTPHRQGSPVKTEFDFVTYSKKGQMKRHIRDSVQQLNGEAAIGHAIQWTVDNVFSKAPNQRKYKAIFILSAGVTSQWDKEVLHDASLRAKCQGYAIFVLSVGHDYDDIELRELASLPLEHHLVQLGRIHKAELGYAAKFLKPFVHLLKSKCNCLSGLLGQQQAGAIIIFLWSEA
uniref:VWFA domain-containing protein n=1 Tax=Anolis carolinensis TaxID=28377 RepID=G1KAQ5_ANOCA